MKYHHRRWPLAEIFADQMLAQDRIGELLRETDVLVPIPLHCSRQIWRGYNQADSLARRLASRRPHLRLAHPLVRLKNTVAQTTAGSIAARAKNLRFAFGLIDPRLVAGKRITLVDDVSTTASTLKAAACEIKSASPAAINALVIAVADPKRRDFQTV